MLGDLSEIKVEADLVGNGVNTFVPRQTLPYDLVIELNGEFYRVQIKRASSHYRFDDDRAVEAQLKTSGRDYNGTKRRKYSVDDFDILAVYCVPWDEVAYEKWDEAKTCITLWEDAEKSGAPHLSKGIEDYQWESITETFK